MTRIWRCGLGLVVLGVIFRAWDDDELDPENSQRGAHKLVQVCHKLGNGKFVPLVLPTMAAEAHLAHGDALGSGGKKAGQCGHDDPDLSCEDIAGCPAMQCRTVSDCVRNQCAYQFSLPGTEIPEQIAGDCHALVCDGNGGVVAVFDDTDVPDDGDTCTMDACKDGVPMHVPPAAPKGGSC